jgi:hypothetical protein
MTDKKIIEIGSRVHSKKIGRRAEFDGTVEGRRGAHVWHVRADDDGDMWHRTTRELQLLKE